MFKFFRQLIQHRSDVNELWLNRLPWSTQTRKSVICDSIKGSKEWFSSFQKREMTLKLEIRAVLHTMAR